MIAAKPDCTVPLPVPSPDLVIQSFDSAMCTTGGPPRFLVVCGARQHVVGEDVRVLLDQLRKAPASWDELADRHASATGRASDVAALQRLVAESMPRDWFNEGSAQASAVADPFLWRADLFSGQTLAPLTRRFAALFDRRLALLVVLGFVLVLALSLPVAATRIHADFSAGESLGLVVCLMLGVVWHEFGHLAAVARAGVAHGSMGVGLYWFVPAMYADVSQAWRVPPRARVLIDVGGLYFQAMFAIGIGAYALASDSTFAYKLIWMTTFTMLHTLNPFFKFDGYWMLSDATGLTNLHAQVRTTAIGVLRRLFLRSTEPRSAQHRLQLRVLYAYTALCGIYFAYIVYFLRGALISVGREYPSELDSGWTQARHAIAAGDVWAAIEALVDVIAASFWPACLAVSCLLVAWIVLSRMAKLIVAAVSAPRIAGNPA
jgi:putative peptide zinc metalloprotease protein